MQAGCHVITECQVQYVVNKPYEIYEEEGIIGTKRRRWHVYLNEIDCITADFVVLSGTKQY
jgi:hypothetical protein